MTNRRQRLLRIAPLAAAMVVAISLSSSSVSQASPATEAQECPAPSGDEYLVDEVPPGVDVMECDLVGELITNDDGATLAVPEPGEAVSFETLPGDHDEEPVEFSVEVSHDGELSYAPDAPDLSAQSSEQPCTTAAYNLLGKKWKSTMSWSINKLSVPDANLDSDNAVTAIRGAVGNIVNQANDCGFADLVSATQQFDGVTTHHADIHNDLCDLRSDTDGMSVVSFGNELTGSALAGTCTWGDVQDGPNKIVQADVLIDQPHAWTTVGASSSCDHEWDLESVMTHEFGHAYGLAHVPAHSSLTMYPYTAQCDIKMRTLGQGDVIGLRQYY